VLKPPDARKRLRRHADFVAEDFDEPPLTEADSVGHAGDGARPRRVAEFADGIAYADDDRVSTRAGEKRTFETSTLRDGVGAHIS